MSVKLYRGCTYLVSSPTLPSTTSRRRLHELGISSVSLINSFFLFFQTYYHHSGGGGGATTDDESYVRTDDDDDGGGTDWEDNMRRWINR